MSHSKTMKKEYSVEQRARIGRNVGLIGIGVNILLFVIKLCLGLRYGGVSIIADAVNNLTDAGVSIIVIIGYIISAKPADHEHPYGHARMEYLSSLLISVIITVLGIELISSSVKSIINPGESAEYEIIAVIIMAITIIAKILLALFYFYAGKKIDSRSIRASAFDCIGDVCATGAVILGIVLTPVIGPISDGIFGAAIAVYILVMGIKLVIESANTLIGTPPDIELIKSIVSKLKSYDGIIGIHDLVVHNYGVDKYFATVHLEMDSSIDVMVSHDLIDNIEVEFMEQMGINLVVHYDPVALNDERVNDLKNRINGIVSEISSEYSSPISFHDFRVVFGVTHINIIFDVAITHEMPLSDIDIVNLIKESVKKNIGKEYNVVITVDRDYTTTRY